MNAFNKVNRKSKRVQLSPIANRLSARVEGTALIREASLSNIPKTKQKIGKAPTRRRAHSAQAKSDLRATFIATGRRLLAAKESSEVSLRSIATAAGYSPGTIYQYFGDHRALLLAIREEDMLAAVVAFEAIAASESDPEERVVKVFLGVARHWLDNFDHYETLFSLSPSKIAVSDASGLPFGRSAVVVRSYSLYDRIVRDVLAFYGVTSIDPKCAVDSLIAAVHGIVSFPMYTRTMDWTEPLKMIEFVVRSLLSAWRLDGRM